jgi:hypothetical protein
MYSTYIWSAMSFRPALSTNFPPTKKYPWSARTMGAPPIAGVVSAYAPTVIIRLMMPIIAYFALEVTDDMATLPSLTERLQKGRYTPVRDDWIPTALANVTRVPD